MKEGAEHIGHLTTSEDKGMNGAPKSVYTFAMNGTRDCLRDASPTVTELS